MQIASNYSFTPASKPERRAGSPRKLMKKLTLLALLFAVLPSTAMAADKAGDPCATTGYVSQTGNELLSCVDGKGKRTGQVGTMQITIGVQLLEGDKRLISSQVTTLDGQPTPLDIGTKRPYIAEAKKEGDEVVRTPGTVMDGFFMTLTPTLRQDGKIAVEFVANKSEVTSIQTFKQGDLEVEFPEVSTVRLKQKLTLDNGKEILIPFGALVEPMESVEAGKLPRTQYTLKLVAESADGFDRVVELCR